MPNAYPRPGLLVGLIRARVRCSSRGTSFGRSVQPRPPYFRRGRRTDLSPRGRVPPIPEVPGRALTPDSSKRLHIHAVPLSSTPARPFLDTSLDDPHASQRARCPVSDDSSSIQQFGDERRAEPRELQLRSPRLFQRYVVNPYQLSRLILWPLDFTA